MNNTRSRFRRLVIAGGAAFVLSLSALSAGAYALLKPTAAASGPISTVALTDSTNLSQAQTVYQIDTSASQASFSINEVLRGSPKTVVGTSDQVSGQFGFDASTPGAVQVGTILIDARTLVTDDSQRNRAIDNQILSTDQYEYISFTPTQVSGLPDSVTVGQPFTFQMTGDLTIRGTTQPATFDLTVTQAADGTLSGTASSTIDYSNWGISIPNVPFVASVGNQVVLQLTFGATATA